MANGDGPLNGLIMVQKALKIPEPFPNQNRNSTFSQIKVVCHTEFFTSIIEYVCPSVSQSIGWSVGHAFLNIAVNMTASVAHGWVGAVVRFR